MDNPLHNSKIKLLDAMLKVVRTKGYSASTVDDICAAAGVTKGSFFHHFKGKLELALAAVDYWNSTTGGLFANAPYRQIADPRDRVLAYIDFRCAIVQGEAPDYTCLLGTLVQETFDSHPGLRAACHQGITMHAQTVAIDLAAAKAAYAPGAQWDPEALALYTQAVIQGAFILAKAQGSAEIARTCIAQLRSHVAGLLGAAGNVSDRPHQETPPCTTTMSTDS
jgi:TetR/AcrR family transcriptional repressor of nem operon